MSPVWRRIQTFPWALIFLLVNCFGVLLFQYRALDGVARQRGVDWLTIFLEEMTGAYSQLPLIPLIAWLALSYPIAIDWKRRLPVYLAAGVVYSFFNTTIIYALRLVTFDAIGQGVYDYGLLHVRYFMEMPMQLILFSTIVVVITYAEERRTRRDRELSLEILERQLAQAQLESLQLQLQPHFLFNALNAISAVMYEDPRVADRMISRLSDFLRALLRSDHKQEVRLEEEMSLAQLYLDVMTARFEDRLHCAVSCEEDIEGALVPQLLLQPVVENAIRYGIDPQTGKIDVLVRASRNNGRLRLEVTDRGPGITAPGDGGFGLGLKNLHARLERLYGSAGSVSLERNGTGTRVLITIPFHREPLSTGR